jgi:nucleoside-diphosphate-sugar epimerase
LVHTAFSRGDHLPGLSGSIDFTEQIIEWVNARDVNSIINISSQGVYKALQPGKNVDETGHIEPDTAYGLAKWAVENMLKAGCTKPYSNIRMASLSANARFLDFFVQSVMNGKDIIVTAPCQYASLMDAGDAVRGILSIERIPYSERAETYNLGPGSQLSILEFAQLTNKVGQQMGYKPVRIDIQDHGIRSAICMDCRKIAEQTGWEAKVSSEMMIRQLFRKYESVSHD